MHSSFNEINHDAQRHYNQVTGLAAPPEITDWIARNAERNNFAFSLSQQLHRRGMLTNMQIQAVRRAILREEEEKQKALIAPEVSVEPMLEAFARAKEKRVKTPKLRIDSYVFSAAPDHGINAGGVYIKSAGTYLGKIINGRYLASRDASPEDQASIVKIASNPMEAAIAYGRREGRCAICARRLDNHASIDAGIGPICAEKFGW